MKPDINRVQHYYKSYTIDLESSCVRFIRQSGDTDPDLYYAFDDYKGNTPEFTLQDFCEEVYYEWDYPKEFDLELYVEEVWKRYSVYVDMCPTFAAVEYKLDHE